MAEHKKGKHAGHGYKHVHVRHHGDGSHTVKHEHEDGVSHKEHAVPNLDGVHDSLQDNLGSPNPGEAAADAGQHGVPAAQAGPAGLTSTPPAPAMGGATPAAGGPAGI